MQAAAHDRPDRPPVTAPSVRDPWAAASPTVRSRPLIRPVATPGPPGGHSPDDHAIRRFWVAAIGAGAVEDLLRLITAARRGKRIKNPKFISTLIREGLAATDGRTVVVRQLVPPLSVRQRARLSPAMRKEYDLYRGGRCDLNTTNPAVAKAAISPIAKARDTTTSTPPDPKM